MNIKDWFKRYIYISINIGSKYRYHLKSCEILSIWFCDFSEDWCLSNVHILLRFLRLFIDCQILLRNLAVLKGTWSLFSLAGWVWLKKLSSKMVKLAKIKSSWAFGSVDICVLMRYKITIINTGINTIAFFRMAKQTLRSRASWPTRPVPMVAAPPAGISENKGLWLPVI